MANEVKLEEICPAVFGIKARRYRQLADEGVLPKVVKGKVDFVLATKKYIDYLHKCVEGEGSPTLTKERTRKTKAEAEIKELELRKLQGELVDRSEVVDELVRRVYTIKSDLLSIPKRLAKWPDAKDVAHKQVRHIMKTYSRKTGIFQDEEEI